MIESYIVCYDISDPKRLRKVARACEDYGYRKQLSVFLCRLTATDRVKLRNRLSELIKHDEDQVMLMKVPEESLQKLEVLGRGMEAADARDVVVVV